MTVNRQPKKSISETNPNLVNEWDCDKNAHITLLLTI